MAKKGNTGKKISISELNDLMRDPSHPEEKLSQYFEIDEERSGPFAPRLALNPKTVAIPATPEARQRGDLIVAGFNSWERMRRLQRFNERIASGYKGPVIVSEGDSWFQYPVEVYDVIDHLLDDGYAIRSLDAAGDTLANMLKEGEYLDALRETRAKFFLFSAGGNDALGGGSIGDHLRPYDPSLKPEQHLLPSFRALLDQTMKGYETILRRVEDLPGRIHVIVHGYDRPLPNNGKWLGKPMAAKGIKDAKVQKAIVDAMIDASNDRLRAVAANFQDVTALDVRGVVGSSSQRWYDELHPTSTAFGDVAAKFHAAVEKAAGKKPKGAATRGAGAERKKGGRGAAGRSGRRGISLHMGLNEIDPSHYSGDDGALSGCHGDADAMELIAREKGYSILGKLIDKKATRRSVLDGIGEMAREARSGDIAFISYSGHGSQMTDINADETDGTDETWCLYDGMLLDDELYDAWSRFKPGVRVLVISDSCHSGTILRADPGLLTARRRPNGEPRPRFLPLSVARQTYLDNKSFYDRIGAAVKGEGAGAMRRDEIASRPLTQPVHASVRLLSGCQDNQLSMDGLLNGRFTQELLKVWAQGRFAGDYDAFHSRIVRGMPASQTPNHWTVGAGDPAFDAQAPFSI